MKYQPRSKNGGANLPLPEIKGETIWGLHPINAALVAQKREIFSAYYKTGELNERLKEVLGLCSKCGVPMQCVTSPVLDELSSHHPHQGICLDVSELPLEHDDIQNAIESSQSQCFYQPSVWVLPYRVVDPMNMGAILRSAQFFGVSKVVYMMQQSAALSAVVSKASSGAMEIVDILALKTNSMLNDLLKRWKEVGGIVVGTSCDRQDEAVMDLRDFRTNRPALFIFGNEASGLPSTISSQCDVLLYIAGHQLQSGDHPSVPSLNVSVATGILLHSIMNNRLPKGDNS
ncbi:rRNA methyltransferase 1, mitochondrial-like isoform X2 [Dreissena polymorpha]|uniref:rRNA methyltransferase 1, mitochondrial-like isoform X2 n=1 Tax=Dreissena polymorpha TaxID=45954 RepID=UPI002263ED90|nr:rRNA methyltransferase 1, mitochondrial-like isoform X2 [Dreissena polymorpha]XP_052247199.1 rRNA methyltransferase 1, mitochondrial-like isoform X2 [Dreissena polymorpha]